MCVVPLLPWEVAILTQVVDRIAGAHSEVNALREALNRGKPAYPSTMPSMALMTLPHRRMADIRMHGRSRGVRPHQVVVPRAAWRAVPVRVVRGDTECSWCASCDSSLCVFVGPDCAAATGRDDVDLQEKVANVREVVHGLPSANYDLLKRIIEHLDRYVRVHEVD